MLTSRPLQITAMTCSGRILHPERDGGADNSTFRQVRPAVAARSSVRIEIVALTGFGHSLQVKPETVMRRQRQSFRLDCRWKSRHTGQPHAGREVGELVHKICVSSASWGAARFMASCSSRALTYRKQPCRCTWFIAANHLRKASGHCSITTSSNWL